MKKTIICLIAYAILFSFCGCENIIESMDRNYIEYLGMQYSSISQQWEMKSPNNYNQEIIMNNNSSIKIRTYPYDLKNDFIYIENDGLLFHNNASKLPDNNKKNIDYLLLRYHEKTLELKIDDTIIVDEFLSYIAHKKERQVNVNKNIASLIIYYKDYPACYFYGNIITDNKENVWIDLINETSGYLRIDLNSKLLNKLMSVL